MLGSISNEKLCLHQCQRAAPPPPPSCSSVGGCRVAPRAVSKEDDRKAPILWLSCHFWSERRHSSCSCNHFAAARHLPMPLVVDVTPAANTRGACQHHYCTSESLAPNDTREASKQDEGVEAYRPGVSAETRGLDLAAARYRGDWGGRPRGKHFREIHLTK